MARGSALAAVFIGLAVGLLWGTAAAQQQPTMENLRQAPQDRQVKAVGHCGGQYTVSFADGSSRKFGERDLRFASDSTPLGPAAGRPVFVPTGRVGDRGLVVFVVPAEMTAMIRTGC